jgi:hypothetical protein
MSRNVPRLEDLVRDRMFPSGDAARSKRAIEHARNVFAVAQQYRRAAGGAKRDGLSIPVTSNVHEAARLGITAVAARNGLRFRNIEAAHEAAVDYAVAARLCTERHWAKLDQLRMIRNSGNYPADLIELSPETIDDMETVVDAVLRTTAGLVLGRPKAIPPPPDRSR